MTIIHRFHDRAFLHELKSQQMFLTNTEKQWLRYMLQTEKSEPFLQSAYCEQFLRELQGDVDFTRFITVKGRPKYVDVESDFIHTLRNYIEGQQGMQITYRLRSGVQCQEQGIPYKLYYAHAKQTWYVWWMRQVGEQATARRTPVSLILNLVPQAVEKSLHAQLQQTLYATTSKVTTVQLIIAPAIKGLDEQRFIQAFSAFEKKVDRTQGQLRLVVTYLQEDEGLVLSKIRSFGPHLMIQEPVELREKMRETIAKSLARYE